jgi:hypothetical protein
VLAGWFYKCSLSTFTLQFTKKKVAKKKVVIVVSIYSNLKKTNLKVLGSAYCSWRETLLGNRRRRLRAE